MKRGKLGQIVDLGDNVVIDKSRFLEELATVDDAMANSRDFAHVLDNGIRTRAQDIQNHTHGSGMVRQGKLVHKLVFVDTVLVKGLFTANAFA